MLSLTSTSPLLLLALASIAVGAFAQASTGMGFSLVAAPALVAALGPAAGVGVVLALAAVASLLPLAAEWRHVHVGSVVGLLLPTLAWTPVVALVIGHHLWGIGGSGLELAAGLGVMTGVGMLASGWRSPWLRRPVGLVVTGMGSATLNVIGGVGGPPIGMYAANTEWSPRRSRGTLAAFFLAQNVATALLLGVVWPGWNALVALAIGSIAGLVAARRVAADLARRGVLLISLLGGVALVAGAV